MKKPTKAKDKAFLETLSATLVRQGYLNEVQDKNHSVRKLYPRYRHRLAERSTLLYRHCPVAKRIEARISWASFYFFYACTRTIRLRNHVKAFLLKEAKAWN